eukprot:CAMPEP_0196570548 /NCGR_PEP_ID=MMETSP1081-20130531/676_1 /TAXON_ID=36882 /ORGANISM="Pyramimonas amylifera, Strain CCMP720" /LENGTH=146 /DNA_ID=CAMNT_0041887055 /DNA_START=117 /DNA_END=557 /DNA_ORIENTATION=-
MVLTAASSTICTASLKELSCKRSSTASAKALGKISRKNVSSVTHSVVCGSLRSKTALVVQQGTRQTLAFSAALLSTIASVGPALAEEDGGFPVGILAAVALAGAAGFAVVSSKQSDDDAQLMKKNMTVSGRLKRSKGAVSLDDLDD